MAEPLATKNQRSMSAGDEPLQHHRQAILDRSAMLLQDLGTSLRTHLGLTSVRLAA